MRYSKSRSVALTRLFPFGSRRLSLIAGRFGPFAFVFLSAIIFMMSLLLPVSSSSIQMKITDITAPIFETVTMPIEKAAATVSAVTGLADIQAENARLRAENQKLHEWMQAAQILDKENSSLRTLLNFQDNQKFHYTASFVIADSNNAYANSVLLKTGSKNGVTKGQPVINTDGLIGRIVATGNTTSRVLLLNDINSRVPVLIQGLDVKAIMAGSKTGNPIIKRVEDKEASLSNELSVITSGHGGILPYGLPVGKLKKIEDGLFEVVLHADLDNLHYVRVIDSSSSPSILEELQ